MKSMDRSRDRPWLKLVNLLKYIEDIPILTYYSSKVYCNVDVCL